MSNHQSTRNVKLPDKKNTLQHGQFERSQAQATLEQIDPAAALAAASLGQARPVDILQLQRAYGNQAVSGLLGAKLAAGPGAVYPIQRSREDGKPDTLESVLDPAEFKEQTSMVTWKKGSYLKTITTWMFAAWNAKTWVDQSHALRQLTDACDAWLDKHGAEAHEGENFSVSDNRILIKKVRMAAAGGEASSAGKNKKGPADESEESEATNIAAGFADAIGGGSGSTGAQGDRNVVVAPDNYDGDFMDQKGSGKLNRAEFDMLEGANLLGGWLKIFEANKAREEGEKTDAAQKGMEGAGQTLHGGAKLSKGIALKEGGDSTKWTQVGDSGAACADGLAFISGLISTMQSFTQGAVTGQEKTDKTLNIASNVVNTGQAGLNTSLDIFKAITKVGATGGKEHIANMATASGALSIVSGSIDMIQAGIQFFRARAAAKEVQQAEAKAGELIGPIFKDLLELPKQVLPLFESQNLDGVQKVIAELIKLRKMFAQMQDLVHSLQAMRKIQSRKMEDAVFKGLQGTTKVVAGALLVSGVGAPIGVAVAALAGIMSLGKAGVQWRRNAAASRLTTTALRLTEDGQPKGKPDPTPPDYQTMENRIYKCYYNHLPDVILKTTPPGLEESAFSDVKNFAWADKKKRIGKGLKNKIQVNSVDEIQKTGYEDRRKSWVEVVNDKKKVLHKEKPKGTAKAGLWFSASAHKSTQADKSNKKEVVNALYNLGSQSWNRDLNTFVDAPIVPQGKADEETMAELKNITLNALLKAADINAARWKIWLEKSNGDEKKMKEFIEKKLG